MFISSLAAAYFAESVQVNVLVSPPAQRRPHYDFSNGLYKCPLCGALRSRPKQNVISNYADQCQSTKTGHSDNAQVTNHDSDRGL